MDAGEFDKARDATGLGEDTLEMKAIWWPRGSAKKVVSAVVQQLKLLSPSQHQLPSPH